MRSRSQWNYLAFLNLGFLIVVAVLLFRFLRSNSAEKSADSQATTDDHAHHMHDGPEYGIAALDRGDRIVEQFIRDDDVTIIEIDTTPAVHTHKHGRRRHHHH